MKIRKNVPIPKPRLAILVMMKQLRVNQCLEVLRSEARPRSVQVSAYTNAKRLKIKIRTQVLKDRILVWRVK